MIKNLSLDCFNKIGGGEWIPPPDYVKTYVLSPMAMASMGFFLTMIGLFTTGCMSCCRGAEVAVRSRTNGGKGSCHTGYTGRIFLTGSCGVMGSMLIGGGVAFAVGFTLTMLSIDR